MDLNWRSSTWWVCACVCVCVCVHAAGMLAFKRPEVQSQIQQSDVVELVRTALAANPDAVGLAENGQALLSSLWAAGSSSASTYPVQTHTFAHTFHTYVCCICNSFEDNQSKYLRNQGQFDQISLNA